MTHGAMAATTDEDWIEGDEIVEHQVKLSDLLVHTDQEILDSFDRLKEKKAVLNKKMFDLWQKAAGLTFSSHALLLDPTLRELEALKPASQYCHDWMHCCVSAGIFQVAVYVLCSNMSTGWSLVHDYIKMWNLPKHLPQNLAMLFDSKHCKKYTMNQKFQCQASEALTLMPLLVYLVKSILQKQSMVPDHLCKAFLSVAWIVELVHLGQIWGNCTPELLQQASEHCLEIWSAHFRPMMIKKFHWTLHLAGALQRFQKLPSCFAMERKHRFVCRFAASICNTSRYEKSLLQECLAEEQCHLRKSGIFRDDVHLLQPHVASKAFHSLMEQCFGKAIVKEHLLVSAKCQLEKSLCSKQDIVLLQSWCAIEILTFLSLEGEIFAFANVLQLEHEDMETGSTVWVDNAKQCLTPASDLLCPLMYTREPKKIIALIPGQLKLYVKRLAHRNG